MDEIWALPAATAPPGVTPNFVNPPSDLGSAIATIVLCTTVATTAVLIRIWTKGVIMRQFLVEDYIIVLGWLLFIAEEIPASIALKYGNGADMWNVSLSDFSYTLYTNNLTMIFYCLGTLMIKLSVLLQYLRIFVPSPEYSKFTFFAIWATMCGLTIYYVTMTGFLIGLCSPREKIWNFFVPGTCFNVYTLVEASGVLNVVSDVIIFVLPLRCVWSLQLQLRKKLAVSCVFAIGFLACITSVIRCYYSFVIASTNDETYITSILGIWAAAECTMGIVVACAPVFARFYDNVRPKIGSLYPSKRGSSTGSSSSRESGRTKSVRPKGNSGARVIGSRRMGLNDQWRESLFELEKGTLATAAGTRCDADDERLLVEGDGKMAAAAAVDPAPEQPGLPQPAKLAGERADLENGQGGVSRDGIWTTTRIAVDTETVDATRD